MIRASSPLPAGDARASVIDRYVGNRSVVEEARAEERGSFGSFGSFGLLCFLGRAFFSRSTVQRRISVARKGGYIMFIESSCSRVIGFQLPGDWRIGLDWGG